MAIRFPRPLQPGDLIGVTAPSAGALPQFQARFDFALERIRAAGYRVELGECLDSGGVTSASAAERAGELQRMLTDPAIRAVVPPWGGETAIDLLDLLDFEAISAAEPTWFVGYSDISTLLLPFSLLTGVASIHGNNLMDTPFSPAPGTLSWLELVGLGGCSQITQRSPGAWASGHPDYRSADGALSTELLLDQTGTWRRLDARGEVDFTGRLIGGCIETLCNIAGTRFADLDSFASEHAPQSLIVYVEAAQDDAGTICRNLHGMRLRGFFDHAAVILVGRTAAPAIPGMTQDEAVLDALAELDVPIIADVECGHVAPFMPIVNGALGRVRFGPEVAELTQVFS